MAVGLTLILIQVPLLAYVLLQQRTWGGPDRDGANGVAVAADGAVYVTGSTRSFGAGGDDAMLLKYGTDGTLLWQRTYGTAPDDVNSGEEAGIAVAVAPDNSGVVMAGNYRDGNIFVAKFNHAGTLLWNRTWGANQEAATAIAIAADGTIFVTGGTSSAGAGGTDVVLLSFTPTGTLNWQRTWGGAQFDVARDVAVATDGSILVSGEAQFTVPVEPPTGVNGAFLLKFTASGSLEWQRGWGVTARGGIGSSDETLANGVAAAPGGGAYVVGATFGAGFDPNLVAAQFDASGNLVWVRVGGPGFGTAQDVAVTADGNVHLTGNVLTDGGDSGGNAFVWSLSGSGKAIDAGIWGGADPFELEHGESIAAAPDGTLVVVGSAGAPPYALGRGSKSAKSATTFVATTAGIVTIPTRVLGTPVPVVTIPAGSETYAGLSDLFLVRVR